MGIQSQIALGFAVFSVVLFLVQGKFVYTGEETKALGKFRVLVKDIATHEYQTIDSYLIRWLRASKLDINAAVQMFAAAQKWRKEVNIEDPVDESILGLPNLALPSYTTEGVDNEGRTVFTNRIGNLDLRKLLLSGKIDAIKKLHRYASDQAVKKSAETVLRSNGTLTDSRIVIVTDLTGFSLRNHACLACINLHISNAAEAERYFPGAAARQVIINAPRIALPLVNLLLGVASEETKNSLKIFGTDRKEWSEYLLKIIPANQLTYQFGGTRKV